MTTFKTEQEAFWAGRFGDEYIARNTAELLLAGNIALFSRIFARTGKLGSLIEFGANIGLNLKAIQHLFPGIDFAAIEINPTAAAELQAWGRIAHLYPQSILDFTPQRQWDLALIKGVLIHIAPDQLPAVYAKLYQAAARYICLVEYYNPTPVEVPYRGHGGKLFKRDFAGEILDAYPDLRLVDYGFVYRRDPTFPQDDCTWFLLEKPRP